MSEASPRKKGKKNRKYGRNGTYCLQYHNLDTRMKNKYRKVRRHLRKYPSDRQAATWLKNA